MFWVASRSDAHIIPCSPPLSTSSGDEISASELDWATETCGTSVSHKDHLAVPYPGAGSPSPEINSEEEYQNLPGEIGPTRSPRRSSSCTRKAIAPYQVPSTSTRAVPLVPKQITPSETKARPPALTPRTQSPHMISPNLDQTRKPKGKARAPRSPGKSLRKLTAADINLTLAPGQTIQCPWPECRQYVPIDQTLFTVHILQNEETHHLEKVRHAPCPLGCEEIPYNVSRHIIQSHYDRVINCPVDNCDSVLRGDLSHIIRHLSYTAKHSDYEKPADGQPIELVAYVRPKKETRMRGRRQITQAFTTDKQG